VLQVSNLNLLSSISKVVCSTAIVSTVTAVPGRLHHVQGGLFRFGMLRNLHKSLSGRVTSSGGASVGSATAATEGIFTGVGFSTVAAKGGLLGCGRRLEKLGDIARLATNRRCIIADRTNVSLDEVLHRVDLHFDVILSDDSCNEPLQSHFQPTFTTRESRHGVGHRGGTAGHDYLFERDDLGYDSFLRSAHCVEPVKYSPFSIRIVNISLSGWTGLYRVRDRHVRIFRIVEIQFEADHEASVKRVWAS